MSFEIFVTAFRGKEALPLPKEDLRQRFSAHIAREDNSGWWHLAFDDGPCSTEIAPGANGFTAFRPPDYLAFWQIIAGVLRDLPGVLYWPGGGAIVGSLDMVQHMPADMVEVLGVPWVSTDPERIRQLVWDNS